jgi:hypothetical protein
MNIIKNCFYRELKLFVLDHDILFSDNFDNIDFFQYNPGIETRILKTFYDEGFKLLNPCNNVFPFNSFLKKAQ